MCTKHPTYKAIRKPKISRRSGKTYMPGKTCEECWKIYNEKHGTDCNLNKNK